MVAASAKQGAGEREKAKIIRVLAPLPWERGWGEGLRERGWGEAF
jgi:hypothetical protein